MKTLLKKIADLANIMDQKGLYEEASVLDDIVKEAAANEAAMEMDKEWGRQFVNKIVDNAYLKDNIKEYISSLQSKPLSQSWKDIYRRFKQSPNYYNDANGVISNTLNEFANNYAKSVQWAKADSSGEPPLAKPQDREDVAGTVKEKKKLQFNKQVQQAQQQYNAKRKELASLIGAAKVKSQFPWLKPDGLLGPNTRRVQPRTQIGKMQAMIDQAKKQKEQAGTAQPQVQPQVQTQAQANAIAGQIWKALLENNDTAGKNVNTIAQKAKELLGKGMDPNDVTIQLAKEVGA